MIRTHIARGFAVLLGVMISADTFAGMFVYPEKGQSKEQQELDQFTCYKWAKEQSGIDPNQTSTAAAPPPPQQGQVAGGAMRGAAVGAVGGAIAGDAGKGAAVGAAVGGGAGAVRKRRGEMQYEQSVQAASADQQQKQQQYNRAYGVCLEGKGYKVG